jgi:hypothetical protein
VWRERFDARLLCPLAAGQEDGVVGHAANADGATLVDRDEERTRCVATAFEPFIQCRTTPRRNVRHTGFAALATTYSKLPAFGSKIDKLEIRELGPSQSTTEAEGKERAVTRPRQSLAAGLALGLVRLNLPPPALTWPLGK